MVCIFVMDVTILCWIGITDSRAMGQEKGIFHVGRLSINDFDNIFCTLIYEREYLY